MLIKELIEQINKILTNFQYNKFLFSEIQFFGLYWKKKIVYFLLPFILNIIHSIICIYIFINI